MSEDKLVELVMGAKQRTDAAAQEFDGICKKYSVTAVFVEVRRAGTTVQLGIDWVPNETLGMKPSLLKI